MELSARGTSIVQNNATLFNKMFSKCPVVQYTRNRKVYSLYKRISPIPSGFDAHHIFAETWSSANNLLHTDFEMYSSLTDLKANKNPWQCCNYNDPGVGYPRDCGPIHCVGYKWFTLPGTHHRIVGLTAGTRFQLFSESDCPIDHPGK